jgi:hypothetical protein
VSLLIDQLASYLQAQGEGTVGVDIFEVHRPSSPGALISLHPTGGYPPDAYTERERPTVQITCRATSPDAALRKAYGIYRKLHRQQHVDLGGGIFALTVQAESSPAYIGTEQAAGGSYHLASLNVAFDLRRPSS